ERFLGSHVDGSHFMLLSVSVQIGGAIVGAGPRACPVGGPPQRSICRGRSPCLPCSCTTHIRVTRAGRHGDLPLRTFLYPYSELLPLSSGKRTPLIGI